MQRFIKYYFKNLYPDKLKNLKETGKCLDIHDLSKLNQVDIKKKPK